MAKKPLQKPALIAKMDRKKPTDNDRSNNADRSGTDRRGDRRTGEGSESALANLKNIERDRQRSKPADEGGSGS